MIILETEMSLEEIETVFEKHYKITFQKCDYSYVENSKIFKELQEVEGEPYILEFIEPSLSCLRGYNRGQYFMSKIVENDGKVWIQGIFERSKLCDVVVPLVMVLFILPTFILGTFSGLSNVNNLDIYSYLAFVAFCVMMMLGSCMYRFKADIESESAYELMLKLLKATDISDNKYAKKFKDLK